jgi:hypothetical protein
MPITLYLLSGMIASEIGASLNLVQLAQSKRQLVLVLVLRSITRSD